MTRAPQIYGTPDEENPEWTEEMLARAKPATEVFSPEAIAQHEAMRRRGKQKAPTKSLVSLRLDQAVIAAFRSTGKGWQGRINSTLAKHAPRVRAAAKRKPIAKRSRASAKD